MRIALPPNFFGSLAFAQAVESSQGQLIEHLATLHIGLFSPLQIGRCKLIEFMTPRWAHSALLEVRARISTPARKGLTFILGRKSARQTQELLQGRQCLLRRLD
jgi:hypothetical protein